jgi:hypothetical protein
MRTKLAGCVFALVGFCGFSIVEPATAQIWKHLVPASYEENTSSRGGPLTQDHGPWMIMAASFDGDGAGEQAQQLADELSSRHGLAAYVHDRTFDHSDGQNQGRGLDNYGAPLRTRYQQERAHEFAVLVGDFQSIDDPDAQRTLERVKTLPSTVLEGDAPDSPMDEVRRFSTELMSKVGKQRARGPMGRAFFTRNPLLPREYFVPKGVDEFVVKMNQGVENSLLDCPGRYTVQVATFRGKTLLQTNDISREESGRGWNWGKGKENPLVEAAENAHLLVEELRRHGWEAYEFHDRNESVVAIGSFDQAATRLATGQLAPTEPVQKIVETFGAAYNTPSDPLTGDDVRRQRRAEELKQQFNQMLSSHDGQVVAGLNPKHVKIMRGKKVERIIPIDVYPHVIEVPRRSLSGAYARQN